MYDVPQGATKAQVKDKAIQLGLAVAEDFMSPQELEEQRIQKAVWSGQMSAADPDAPIEGMDYVSGLASQTAQGAFASWADEMGAAAVSGLVHLGSAAGLENVPFTDQPLNIEQGETVQQTYNRIRNSMRSRDKTFRQQNPITSVTANVVGGMVPLSKGMSAIEGGAAGVAGMSAMGGGYGLADYLGELDEFTDFEIMQAAGRTGLGAAIPAGIAGTGGIIHWIRNREVDEVAGILKELQRHARMSPADLAAEANKMGRKTASLVDVTGDVGVAYGQAAKQVGGMDVANTVEKNLKGKLAIAKKSIRGMMRHVTGKDEFSYYDTLNELKTARKARANELYGTALDKGNVTASKKMLAIMNQNPTVREAWEQVQNNYSRNNLRLPELFDQDATGKIIGTMKDGKLTGRGQFPNMRAVQEMKWEMDKMLNTLSGSVDSAGKVQYQRLLRDRAEFLDEVYKQNPMFKKANEVFAGDMALEGSQMAGRQHGIGKLNVEEQLDYIKTLNPSEKDAYLQGVMSDVYNTLGRSREDLVTGANRLVNENSQAVLDALVGKKGRKAIMQEFETGRRFAEVQTQLRYGSQTAHRQAAGESFANRLKTVNVEDLKQMAPSSKVANWVLSKLPRKYGKLEAHDIDVLANLMTKKGGVQMAVERMRNAGLNPYEIEQYIKLISAAGTAATGATGEETVQRTPVDPMQGLMQ